MRTCALVVAGGAGERMRRSGSAVPKPLVPVRGATLLEHNVSALLAAGVTDVRIAVSTLAPEVRTFADTRCADLAASAGARLEVIVEDPPLGSLGAAALLREVDEVLVVNADNLTTLDLRLVLEDHRASGAAMTLAVHDEPFPMPFGEITLEGSRVLAYREKPTYRITICSAVTVLGAEALSRMVPGEPVGLPVFANRLLHEGLPVHAFRHAAAWVDVNDLTVAARAEELLAPPVVPSGDVAP